MNCLGDVRPNTNWELQRKTNLITDFFGLPRITLLITNYYKHNACADNPTVLIGNQYYKVGDQLYIAYNVEFMEQIEEIGEWAVFALLAHEIGHHFHKHPVGGYSNYPSIFREKQADYFAGYVVRYFGGQCHIAIQLFNHPLFEKGWPTHPDRPQRKEEFKKGWIAADKELNPEKYKAKQQAAKQDIVAGIATALVFGTVAGLAVFGISRLIKSK